MKTPAHDFDDFQHTLKAQGVQTETLRIDDKGTIVLGQAKEAFVSQHLEQLPTIMGEGAAEFSVVGQLGQGGMGTIHLARQSVIEREVAVKESRNQTSAQNLASELLNEGIVTGQLEHPNIVPMYALGKNTKGHVLLVMKRIEGRAWSELLREYRASDDESHLERHLRILIDVSEAIAFAHTKGIVHCDLKPQNIMLGSFGEVYVLDWGLALAFRDDAIKGAPSAASRKGISGTPAYMAPEMTLVDEIIDEKTDVYLLGAILFEILTGRPPHDRVDVMKGLHDAFLSKVTIDDEVPDEIKQICLKALKRNADERFADVRALIEAIEGFLDHASARALEKAARSRLQIIEENPSSKSDVELQRIFAESLFGFDQALKSWPESTSIRDGRRRALTAMARYELHQGNHETAQRLLNNLEVPDDLKRALDEHEQNKAQQAREFESYRRAFFEQDSAVGTRARAIFIGAIGILWCLFQFSLAFVKRGTDFQPNATQQMTAIFVMLLASAIVSFIKRKVLFENRVSASYIWALFAFFLGLEATWALGAAAQVPTVFTFAFSHVVMAAMSGILATRDRRFLPGLFYLIGCLSVFYPKHMLELNGLAVLLSAGGIALLLFSADKKAQTQ